MQSSNLEWRRNHIELKICFTFLGYLLLLGGQFGQEYAITIHNIKILSSFNALLANKVIVVLLDVSIIAYAHIVVSKVVAVIPTFAIAPLSETRKKKDFKIVFNWN